MHNLKISNSMVILFIMPLYTSPIATTLSAGLTTLPYKHKHSVCIPLTATTRNLAMCHMTCGEESLQRSLFVVVVCNNTLKVDIHNYVCPGSKAQTLHAISVH